MAMLNNQMVTMVANFIGDIPPVVKSQPQLPQASEKKIHDRSHDFGSKNHSPQPLVNVNKKTMERSIHFLWENPLFRLGHFQ